MIMTSVMHTVQQEKTSKKGILWGGSDGVDHVAIEVLQHDVANRGSPQRAPPKLSPGDSRMTATISCGRGIHSQLAPQRLWRSLPSPSETGGEGGEVFTSRKVSAAAFSFNLERTWYGSCPCRNFTGRRLHMCVSSSHFQQNGCRPG